MATKAKTAGTPKGVTGMTSAMVHEAYIKETNRRARELANGKTKETLTDKYQRAAKFRRESLFPPPHWRRVVPAVLDMLLTAHMNGPIVGSPDDSDTYRDSINLLAGDGLIDRDTCQPGKTGGAHYVITARGRAYVNLLCRIPFPIEKTRETITTYYVDHDGKEIES